MTAAVITATGVQKIQVPSNIIYGATERRLMQLFLEGPKAAQSDWFLLSSYLTSAECDNILSFRASIKTSDNAQSADTPTYDDDDDKVVLAGTSVGTSYVFVDYYTE